MWSQVYARCMYTSNRTTIGNIVQERGWLTVDSQYPRWQSNQLWKTEALFGPVPRKPDAGNFQGILLPWQLEGIRQPGPRKFI